LTLLVTITRHCLCNSSSCSNSWSYCFSNSNAISSISFETESELTHSNHIHFHHVLLSNHSQFLVIFKFFVHIVFHIANCFHPYHLTQNRSCRESKLGPSILHLCRQFLCRRIPRSSLAVHFHANVLSGMVSADAEFSERRNIVDGVRLNDVIALFTRFMKFAAGKSVSHFHIFPILQKLLSSLGSLCASKHA
jgi:hypothetical protein